MRLRKYDPDEYDEEEEEDEEEDDDDDDRKEEEEEPDAVYNEINVLQASKFQGKK